MSQGALVGREDRDAEVLLQEFLESPMTAAWTALATRRRYRTGGVVRKLNAAAHDVCENDPLVALTFAEAAISVAEALPDDLYPAGAVNRLRGTAWKERANAQMLLGQLPQAHDSLDRAERAYRKSPKDSLGPSITALVRAGVLYEQERFDEAMATAERAELGFAHSSDEQRRMDALFLRGAILQRSGQPRGAVPLFLQIIDYGEHIESPLLVAHGSYALANCEVDLGNLSEASLHFHNALIIFRAFGAARPLVLTEWGMARVVLHSGRSAEAIRRLRDVAAGLERRGLVTDAALAGLDIAEALLATGNPRQIVELAQHIFQVLQEAGVLTGALAAVAYLKEAAAAGTLTSEAVKEIRVFLRRAERQPDLRFVPPPPPPPEESV
ncbi:MAG TPA: tetratricopeptide repeat protein [Thermoanaerobaculia bacterium]|nr:tetratricopeptide repeat protein [Thermoanaerobaculia bacterium]